MSDNVSDFNSARQLRERARAHAEIADDALAREKSMRLERDKGRIREEKLRLAIAAAVEILEAA